MQLLPFVAVTIALAVGPGGQDFLRAGYQAEYIEKTTGDKQVAWHHCRLVARADGCLVVTVRSQDLRPGMEGRQSETTIVLDPERRPLSYRRELNSIGEAGAVERLESAAIDFSGSEDGLLMRAAFPGRTKTAVITGLWFIEDDVASLVYLASLLRPEAEGRGGDVVRPAPGSLQTSRFLIWRAGEAALRISGEECQCEEYLLLVRGPSGAAQAQECLLYTRAGELIAFQRGGRVLQLSLEYSERLIDSEKVEITIERKK